MISFGGIPLQIPGAEEAAWIESNMPISSCFNFFRAAPLSDPALNPRAGLDWFLSRPMRLNTYFCPWGAARWSYAFVLADGDMISAITSQNTAGGTLPFVIDDNLGSSILTPMLMLAPIPLSKILNTLPQLPLYLLALVDSRLRWWEAAASITVVEGSTTWASLYAAIASALGIVLTVDPVAGAYLNPGAGLSASYEYLPLLLDRVASSCGQRICRLLNGTFAARNASTAKSLMIAQANVPRKIAGGSLDLGAISA